MAVNRRWVLRTLKMVWTYPFFLCSNRKKVFIYAPNPLTPLPHILKKCPTQTPYCLPVRQNRCPVIHLTHHPRSKPRHDECLADQPPQTRPWLDVPSALQRRLGIAKGYMGRNHEMGMGGCCATTFYRRIGRIENRYEPFVQQFTNRIVQRTNLLLRVRETPAARGCKVCVAMGCGSPTVHGCCSP